MFPAVSTRQECVIPGAPSWQQPHQRNGDGPISENQARSSRDEPRLEATYRKALARRAGGGWLVAGLCGADAGGTSGHVRRGRPNNPNSRGCTRVLLYSSQHATDLLRRSVHQIIMSVSHWQMAAVSTAPVTAHSHWSSSRLERVIVDHPPEGDG